MGGGSKQPSNTTSVTTTEPPAWARPYLQDLADRARAGTVARPYQAFPGQRIANLNTIQQQGLNSMYARAKTGSPLNRTAQDRTLATLRGDYLNRKDPYLTETASGKFLDVGTNPYWQAMSRDIANAYATGTAAQTDAAFSGGRNYGGSAYNEVVGRNQKALGEALGTVAGQIYQGERGMMEQARAALNQNYLQERANQLSAMQFAPQLAETDYADIDRALSVGDILRENEQDIINARYEDWFNAQEYPREMLDLYSVLLNRAMGGGSQSTVRQPNLYRPNRTANAVAGSTVGGLAGYGIGQGFGGSGGTYGGAIGAGIGGLLGAFG